MSMRLSAFQQISMYPFSMLTDENIPLKFPMAKYNISRSRFDCKLRSVVLLMSFSNIFTDKSTVTLFKCEKCRQHRF